MDVALYHLNEFLFAGKPSAVIAFTFQDPPKTFHRTVVNAMSHTGHALRHPGLLKLVVKRSAGVLVTSVAVKQGMCVWIGPNSFIKGLVNKGIIVVFAQGVGHDASVTKIQDGTEVELMHGQSFIPFEFGHIGQPLLVRLFSVKLPVQNILSKELGIFCVPGAAMAAVFDGRSDIQTATDTQYPFIVHMNTFVVT